MIAKIDPLLRMPSACCFLTHFDPEMPHDITFC
jgi:hypothetical protein